MNDVRTPEFQAEKWPQYRPETKPSLLNCHPGSRCVRITAEYSRSAPKSRISPPEQKGKFGITIPNPTQPNSFSLKFRAPLSSSSIETSREGTCAAHQSESTSKKEDRWEMGKLQGCIGRRASYSNYYQDKFLSPGAATRVSCGRRTQYSRNPSQPLLCGAVFGKTGGEKMSKLANKITRLSKKLPQ